MADIESSFFPSVKREITVTNYAPLKSRGNESRKKLQLAFPIEGDSVVGMPDWIGDAYEIVAADNGKGHCNRVNLDVLLKGMTIEVYSTPSSPRSLLLTGTTIKNLFVERVGKEEKAKFFLHATVYTSDSKALHDWLREIYQMSAFAKFDHTQESLDLSADDEDEDDEDEDEDDAGVVASGTLVGDNFDAERRADLAPAEDQEFGARTSKLVSVKPRPRSASRVQ